MSRSSVVWGDFSIVWGLPLQLSQRFYTATGIAQSQSFYSGWEHSLAVLTNISAVYLQKLYLELYSGITTTFLFNLGEKSNFCTVFSGALQQQWHGFALSAKFPDWLRRFRGKTGKNDYTGFFLVFMLGRWNYIQCSPCPRYNARSNGMEAANSFEKLDRIGTLMMPGWTGISESEKVGD